MNLKNTGATDADARGFLLKLYGERNSGTNYVEALLRRNLDAVCLRGVVPTLLRLTICRPEAARDLYFGMTYRRNLGWKHALVPSQENLARVRIPPRRLLLFITVTKNPYSWLLSLYRRPYHATRKYSSFEEFLTLPWRTVGRENGPASFENPIELWNAKNRGYIALGDYSPALNHRYEDFLADPLALLERLCDEHGVPRRRGVFENVLEPAKRRDRKGTQMSFDAYRDYYLGERWREKLDARTTALINEHLDREVASYFDYELLS